MIVKISDELDILLDVLLKGDRNLVEKITKDTNENVKLRKKIKLLVVALLFGVAMISLLYWERESDVDGAMLESISGEYQVVEEGSEADSIGYWWHLSIYNDVDKGPYLSIYDNSAGNPGVEGRIFALDDSNIKVKCDSDLTEEMPSDKWKQDGDYLKLKYEVKGNSIFLENSDRIIEFQKQ